MTDSRNTVAILVVLVGCLCAGQTAVSVWSDGQSTQGLQPGHAPKTGSSTAPGRGPAEAPIAVVVFSDFECRACALTAVVLDELRRAYPEQVRYAFKHVPQDEHPSALLAHEAALAAGEQDRFWEMHDLIFLNQERIQRGDLSAMAAQIGLDVPRFEADRDSGRYRETIEVDKAEAARLGITELPTIFVNSRKLTGAHKLHEFRQVVEEELLRIRVPAP